MKDNIKKYITVIAIIIIICFLMIIATRYPSPHGGSTPIIDIHKSVEGEWNIYQIIDVNGDYGISLVDYKLILDNMNITDDNWDEWNTLDLIGTTNGLHFCDNDENNELSVGDEIYVPDGYITQYSHLALYHIPTESISYDGEL